MFGALVEIDGLGASLAAALVSTAGVLAIAAFGPAARRNSGYLSAFAVGLLSVGVLFHLIPESLDASLDGVTWIIAGFSIMVLIGITVQLIVNPRADGAALTFGYASIIALAAHSFLDGIIYAAAFHEEPFTGWITIAGLLLHEFPEGVIAFGFLANAGVSTFRASVMAFLAASCTTVAGTLAAALALQTSTEIPMTALLGGAAGALIYVLIFHLAPNAYHAPRKRGYLFAQLGVAIGVAAIIFNHFGGGH